MRLTINKIFILLLTLSFLGFVDSTYLTITHYKNIIPPCTITNGCEKVLSSNFAVIFGIPMAAYGIVYFIASIAFNVLLFQRRKNIWLKRIFMIFNSSGVVAAVILLVIQFLIIKALCQYCMLVELILFLLFTLCVFLLNRRKLE